MVGSNTGRAAKTMTLIQAVPNVSEGRRHDVVARLVDSVQNSPGSRLLDCSSDPSHNRTVLTIVGDPRALTEALLILYDVAIELIDVTIHQGEHPRIGTVDVLPFVPIRNVSIDDCVTLAKEFGNTVANRYGIPVYLYECAATRPERRALESIRRGQLEGLTKRMNKGTWQPDFGPSSPHPTAGASAIGARQTLIAFNVNLETDDMEIASQIARTVRTRDGGLPHVKAIPVRLIDRTRVQVSMNLTDYTRTPIHRVFKLVKREATKRGVKIAESEVVGLIPAEALIASAVRTLKITKFRPDQVLDAQIAEWDADPAGSLSGER
jgi:glutamate formiminotransferase